MVRALKKLQGELIRDGRLTEKEGQPSFLIECLVYNVPNDKFRTKGYVADMRAVLATIFNATLSDVGCKDWLEPSERKRPTRLIPTLDIQAGSRFGPGCLGLHG